MLKTWITIIKWILFKLAIHIDVYPRAAAYAESCLLSQYLGVEVWTDGHLSFSNRFKNSGDLTFRQSKETLSPYLT